MSNKSVRKAEQEIQELFSNIEACKHLLVESLNDLGAKDDLARFLDSQQNNAQDFRRVAYELEQQGVALAEIRKNYALLEQYVQESRDKIEVFQGEKRCGNEAREDYYRKNLVAYMNRFQGLLISNEPGVYCLDDIQQRINFQVERLRAAAEEMQLRERALDVEIENNELEIFEEDDCARSLDDEPAEPAVEYVDLKSALNKAATMVSDVLSFDLEKAREQFVRYDSLIKKATNAEKRAQLVEEFTISQMNNGPLGEMFAEGEIINPWFATLDRYAIYKQELDDVEQKLETVALNYLADCSDEDQDDIELMKIALARLVHVRGQLESAEMNSLLAKRNEYTKWVVSVEKPERSSLRKVVRKIKSSQSKFNRELKSANYSNFVEMLRNSGKEIDALRRNSLNSQYYALNMLATKHDREELVATVKRLEEALKAAKSSEQLQAVKNRIENEISSIKNFTARRDDFILTGNRVLKYALLHSKVLQAIQDDLFEYATSLEETDRESAQAVYDLILVFGKHTEVEKRSPMKVKFDELTGKRGNIQELKSFGAVIRRRHVTNFIASARELYLELNGEQSDELEAAIQKLETYFAENNFLEVTHTAQDITNIVKDALDDVAESFSNAERARRINDVLERDIIKDGKYVQVLEEMAEFYSEMPEQEGESHSLSVDKIQNIIALFGVDKKVPREKELNEFASIVKRFEGVQKTTETKIKHQRDLANVQEFLRGEHYADFGNSADEAFAATIIDIYVRKSAASARELWEQTNGEYQAVTANLDRVTASFAATAEHKNNLEPIFEEDYEADRKAELVKLDNHEKACKQYHALYTEKKQILADRLRMLEKLKSKICFEDMSWGRRAFSAWKFAVRNPKQIVKCGKEHPIKTAAAMVGMTVFAIAAFKITIPIAAAAAVVKLATTAKIATALCGDTALASVALAEAADNIKGNGSQHEVEAHLPGVGAQQQHQHREEAVVHAADVRVEPRVDLRDEAESDLIPSMA